MTTPSQPLCETCLHSTEFAKFAHACFNQSVEKNNIWLARYRIHSWPSWEYCMDDATLTFFEDGIAKVVCEMQVVGSEEGDIWQWSWGNPNFPDRCTNKMEAVRSFGEEKGWEQLTTLFLPCDEYTGWECASVAKHILNAIGAYRCPTEDGAVYLVILSSQFVN